MPPAFSAKRDSALPAKSNSRKEHPQKQHLCGLCTRAFRAAGHLARHKRTHTGERNHKCPFPGCETICSRQDNLQAHYYIHISPSARRKSGRSVLRKDKMLASIPNSHSQLSTQSDSLPCRVDSPPLEPPPLEDSRKYLCPPPATPPPLVEAYPTVGLASHHAVPRIDTACTGSSLAVGDRDALQHSGAPASGTASEQHASLYELPSSPYGATNVPVLSPVVEVVHPHDISRAARNYANSCLSSSLSTSDSYKYERAPVIRAPQAGYSSDAHAHHIEDVEHREQCAPAAYPSKQQEVSAHSLEFTAFSQDWLTRAQESNGYPPLHESPAYPQDSRLFPTRHKSLVYAPEPTSPVPSVRLAQTQTQWYPAYDTHSCIFEQPQMHGHTSVPPLHSYADANPELQYSEPQLALDQQIVDAHPQQQQAVYYPQPSVCYQGAS